MTQVSAEDMRYLAAAVRDAAAGTTRPALPDDGRAPTDDRLWKVLTEQIGTSGLLVPENEGGSGAGMAALAAVLEELSRTLAAVPVLSTSGMATVLLRVADLPEAGRFLERIANGARASVLWPNMSMPDLRSSMQLSTRSTVSGRFEIVLDGAQCELLLAVAQAEEGQVLVAIEGAADGVVRHMLPSLDLTRGLSMVELDDAQVTPVSSPGVNLTPGLDLALVNIAAEQVGIAANRLDAALDWVKQRVQFDRVIGSFQAVKHSLVDLYMETEMARSALDVAIDASDVFLARPNEQTASALTTAASLAKAICGDAAMRVSDESLHLFGGVGFTWEHDAHLYFRRAKTLEGLLGSPAVHRARLSASLMHRIR
ncbi:acyl-CoA dehydrogenase family protein [Rhodococcus aetherivorans]